MDLSRIDIKRPITICRASAGTGKTYTLAAYYVGLLLSGEDYRSILAITFTNKATAEMSERIIGYLHSIAQGQESDFLALARQFMIRDRQAPDELLEKRAGECFKKMLLDYDNVQIMTIDSFLQTLLSGLAGVLRMSAGLNTELDIDHVIRTAVDQLLTTEMSAADRTILEDYMRLKLDQESQWDVRQSLCAMAKEMYNESVQMLDSNGQINTREFVRALRPGETAVVSVMHANNETGVVFPIEKLSRIVKQTDPKIAFHVDATQSVTKLPINLSRVADSDALDGAFGRVDALSFSGHKIHAPKGVGALFLRRGTAFEPWMLGGHQEKGRRAGTENVPYIMGLAKALELERDHIAENYVKMAALRDKLQRGIEERVPYVVVNGKNSPRTRKNFHFNPQSVDYLRGIFHHAAVIRGEVRLALHTIGDAVINPAWILCLQLDMSRKTGTAHPDHSCVPHRFNDGGCIQLIEASGLRIKYLVIPPVIMDHNTFLFGPVCHQMRPDPYDRAGDCGMHRCGKIPIRSCNHLSGENRIPRFYDWNSRCPDMLLQGIDHISTWKYCFDRLFLAHVLSVKGMDAAEKCGMGHADSPACC